VRRVRERGRERERETERQREGDRERETDRQTNRERERDLEITITIKRVLATEKRIANDPNRPHIALKSVSSPAFLKKKKRKKLD
jgi:hypothetical protein